MALLSICATDDSPASGRDAAMIALFKIASRCRAEMAALNLADYDQAHQTLTIRGKRNKTRVIPIEDAGALDALSDWLYILFTKGIRQEMAAPLFTHIIKGGQVTQGRPTDQGIYHILDTRRQQANMAPFSPSWCLTSLLRNVASGEGLGMLSGRWVNINKRQKTARSLVHEAESGENLE